VPGYYNHITLVGNLTRDPEIRYVTSGSAVTKFALAVNRRSKQGDETMFIDVVAWDKLGETCNTYLKKGMSVLIGGRLAIRKYDSKEGEKRTAVEVVANEMQMLDSKGGGRPSNGEGGGYDRAPASTSHAADTFDEAGIDEEIPF